MNGPNWLRLCLCLPFPPFVPMLSLSVMLLCRIFCPAFPFILPLLLLLVPLSMPMICYNSQAVNPSRESVCEPEEICFGEYYSLRQSADHGSLAHYFDRFCVHPQHCVSRGFWPEGRACLQLDQLDAAVARTFRNKLISERLDPNRLRSTRFCCCSDKNLCNKMDGKEIGILFNVSITMPQQQTLISSGRGGRLGLEKHRGISQNGSAGGRLRWWWTMQIMTTALLYTGDHCLLTTLGKRWSNAFLSNK